MSVKSGELENRQVLGGSEAERVRRGRSSADPEPASAQASASIEAQLAARIEAARNLQAPRDGQPHCGCCWGRGRDAAIRVIEGASS